MQPAYDTVPDVSTSTELSHVPRSRTRSLSSPYKYLQEVIGDTVWYVYAFRAGEVVRSLAKLSCHRVQQYACVADLAYVIENKIALHSRTVTRIGYTHNCYVTLQYAYFDYTSGNMYYVYKYKETIHSLKTLIDKESIQSILIGKLEPLSEVGLTPLFTPFASIKCAFEQLTKPKVPEDIIVVPPTQSPILTVSPHTQSGVIYRKQVDTYKGQKEVTITLSAVDFKYNYYYVRILYNKARSNIQLQFTSVTPLTDTEIHKRFAILIKDYRQESIFDSLDWD